MIALVTSLVTCLMTSHYLAHDLSHNFSQDFYSGVIVSTYRCAHEEKQYSQTVIR